MCRGACPPSEDTRPQPTSCAVADLGLDAPPGSVQVGHPHESVAHSLQPSAVSSAAQGVCEDQELIGSPSSMLSSPVPELAAVTLTDSRAISISQAGAGRTSPVTRYAPSG